jgi:hypothetical protein
MSGAEIKHCCYLTIYQSDSGGRVIEHTFVNGPDRTDNIHAAILLAKLGYKITLLPEIHAEEIGLRLKYLPEAFENKNPDVRINDKWLGDFKKPDPSTTIKKATINRMIRSAAQQKVDIAILNLAGRDYSVQELKKGILGALQPDRNKSIRFVWIITCKKNLFILDRNQAFDDSVYDSLDVL